MQIFFFFITILVTIILTIFIYNKLKDQTVTTTTTPTTTTTGVTTVIEAPVKAPVPLNNIIILAKARVSFEILKIPTGLTPIIISTAKEKITKIVDSVSTEVEMDVTKEYSVNVDKKGTGDNISTYITNINVFHEGVNTISYKLKDVNGNFSLPSPTVVLNINNKPPAPIRVPLTPDEQARLYLGIHPTSVSIRFPIPPIGLSAVLVYCDETNYTNIVYPSVYSQSDTGMLKVETYFTKNVGYCYRDANGNYSNESLTV